MVDAAPRRLMSSELGYGCTGGPVSTERLNLLVVQDRPYHRRHVTMEEEARVSRVAWAQSMDASDKVRSEGMSLRTTVIAQQLKNTELRVADRRRQAAITEMLALDRQR
ncbi:hypothetical protein Tco_1355359 [Tanacetum coccineum]